VLPLRHGVASANPIRARGRQRHRPRLALLRLRFLDRCGHFVAVHRRVTNRLRVAPSSISSAKVQAPDDIHCSMWPNLRADAGNKNGQVPKCALNPIPPPPRDDARRTTLPRPAPPPIKRQKYVGSAVRFAHPASLGIKQPVPKTTLPPSLIWRTPYVDLNRRLINTVMRLNGRRRSTCSFENSTRTQRALRSRASGWRGCI